MEAVRITTDEVRTAIALASVDMYETATTGDILARARRIATGAEILLETTSDRR